VIEVRQIEFDVAEGLKAHLECEVARANQNSPIPAYPYVSYTITTLMRANNGTWVECEDGTKHKEVQQIWSFTVQADNDTESKVLAIDAHNYFDEIGTIYLNDKGIVVQLLGDITNRDNFLTTGYEYRNGFDVTFAFVDEISESNEIIESVVLYDEIEETEVERNIEDLNEMLEERLDGDSVTISSLKENVKQAISVLDDIEEAIEEISDEELDGSDTSTFARRIKEAGKQGSTEFTIVRWSEADFKDGE
jgi:hypothetical protein